MADPVSLAITVAINAASMALTASRKIEGPRLADLNVTVADYGTPLNYFYGIRRLECPCFFAEPLKEKKKKQKGKSGKYAEYKYYATFAILLADHEIIDYRRIWFDRHLVYDTTGSEDEIYQIDEDNSLTSYMRFYFGTSDQSPDPRMVAYIEENEGAGRCPSYLDIAYLMFEALPLEFLGNRPPQVSIEAEAVGSQRYVIVGDPSYDQEVAAAAFSQPIRFVSANGRYAAGGGYYTTKYVLDANYYPDLVTKTALPSDDVVTTDGVGNLFFGFRVSGVDDEGSLWGVNDEDGTPNLVAALQEITPDEPDTIYVRHTFSSNGASLTNFFFFNFNMPDGSIRLLVIDNEQILFVTPRYHMFTKGGGPSASGTITGFMATYAFQDDYGDIWITGCPRVLSAPQSTLKVRRLTDVTGLNPYPADQTFTVPVLAGATGVYSSARPAGAFRDGSFVGALVGPPGAGGTLDLDRLRTALDLFSANLNGSGTVISRDISAAPLVFATQQYPTNPDRFFVTPESELQESPNFGARTFIEINADLSEGTTYLIDDWGAPDTDPGDYPRDVYPTVYLDESGAFAGYRADFTAETIQDGEAFVYYLAAMDLNLGYICSDVIARAGLASSDFDFSSLDQPIYGYSWTIGRAGDIVAHLLDIHDSDIFPSGFSLLGRKRGGALDGAAITAEYMVRQARDESPNSAEAPLYEIVLRSESDLPRRVFATFADADAEQQPNTAVAQRTAVAVQTVREVPVDITTLAATPDEIQPLAERWLRRQHIGGTGFRYTAAPSEIGLTPADNRVSLLDDQAMRGRCTRMVIRADRSIETEWELDGPVAYAPPTVDAAGFLVAPTLPVIEPAIPPTAPPASPGAPQLGRPPPVVFDPEPAIPFVLDIPLVTDADDQTTPFVYLAAAREETGGTYPGAEIQQSDLNLDDWVAGWGAVNSDAEAVWGECESVLGDALPWVPDRASVLVVNIPQGDLESFSDAYLAANPSANLAAVGSHANGWEIIQFGEAVVQSAGIWYVSNLYRRGVRGTERFMPTHGAGDQFVLLQSLAKRDLGASEIGDTDYYRAVTNTLEPDGATVVELAFTAAAHRPLSPVHVQLERDAGTGDWSGTFTRRTRVGGGTVNGQDVPLGEASESYRVKVMNGVTVVRTITVASQAFVYTAAQQTTDWGSPQINLVVDICQMNPTLSIEGAATRASA